MKENTDKPYRWSTKLWSSLRDWFTKQWKRISQWAVNFWEPKSQLDRAIWVTASALVVVVVGFSIFYYFDRYVAFGDKSPSELAASELEDYIRDHPEDIEARLSLAHSYYDSGLYQKAIQTAVQIAETYPENDVALFILGMSYIRIDNREVAIEYLEDFAAIRRQSPMAKVDDVLETALYFLGESYNQLNQSNKAIEVLEEALAISATDADAMYQLGMAYAAAGEHDLALEQFHRAVQFVPDFIEAYQAMVVSYTALEEPGKVAYARGTELYASEDFESAFAHLEQAVEDYPEFVPGLIGMALVYEKNGDYDNAILYLGKVIAIQPDNFLAQHAIGRIQSIINESSGS